MTDNTADGIYNIVIECLNLFDNLIDLKTPHRRDHTHKSYKYTAQSFPASRNSDVAIISPRGKGVGMDIRSEHESGERDAINRQERSFDLWIKYTGALAMVGVSLDDRLRDHTEIKEMVVELLHMVARNLQRRT
jgi:hypothetical protein